MKLRGIRPSPSMVLSLIALSISLGGSAYAAVKVTGKNVQDASLTGRDLKNNSLDSRDVKNLNAIDFAAGQAPKDGAQGPQGPKGDPGPKGDTGPAGPFPDNLQSGKTMRGTYAARDTNQGAGAEAYAPITFALPLAAPPIGLFRDDGSVPTPDCPGSESDPQAAPGYLCVYETAGAGAVRGVFNPGFLGAGGPTRWGAGVFAQGTGDVYSLGTWAVTAP